MSGWPAVLSIVHENEIIDTFIVRLEKMGSWSQIKQLLFLHLRIDYNFNTFCSGPQDLTMPPTSRGNGPESRDARSSMKDQSTGLWAQTETKAAGQESFGQRRPCDEAASLRWSS